MTYIVIDDFKLGMDRRKARVAGKPGMLWSGVNGHITRGGDWERRKRFVPAYNLPAGTFGLAAVAGQLFVFGSTVPPGGIPAGINYQRLAHPDGVTAMAQIVSVTTFSGKIYAIALYVDGNQYHFYNGVRVTSWDSIAASVASNNAVATTLAAFIDADPLYTASATGPVITIASQLPGTAFTYASNTVNGGAVNDQTITMVQTQANVPPVVEVRATGQITVTGGTSNPGTNKISSVTINGVEVLSAAVDWTTSNANTASLIAAQINAFSSTPDYTASATGAVVTILAAAGSGAGPNGYVVATTTAGTMTVSTTGTMAGGVTAVAAVAQIVTATIGGTFEAADVFRITLNATTFVTSGAGSGTGTFALTFQSKMYSTTASLAYFSALNDPSSFGSGVGNGFINMANQNEGNESLTAIQEYQGFLAFFSRRNIRVWSVDPDPANNVFRNTVQNTGTRSPRSVIPYGNIDVFYLDDTGVRSLRARDASNAPSVNDVGVSIDSFIRDYTATLTDSQIQRACAIIEPLDGRYWLAIANRIFVFSYFPGSKINAWSYYDLADEIGTQNITEMVRVANQTFLRSGNVIYVYGGISGDTYPAAGEVICEISLPFLAAGTPATFKGIRAFDIACTGVWDGYLLPEPTDETVELHIGQFNTTTFGSPAEIVQMPASLFSFRARCATAGAASISMLAFHYKATRAD